MLPTTSPAASSASARARLLEAALRCFGERGALATTLEEVRVEAGVSVGALYHHFVDKTGLATALYVDLTRDYHRAFLAELQQAADAEDGVKRCVREHLRWIDANPAGAAFMYEVRPQDNPELRELNRASFAELWSWWKTHVHYGVLRDLPFDVLYALWLGPAQEYSRHRLAGATRKTQSPPDPEIVETFVEAAWRALSTKEPR